MIRCLTVLACILACSYAATSGRSPSKPAAVIGEQGKDRDRPILNVNIPAFASAGNKPGVEAWRIEKFNPVPVSKNDIGKFHTGDSYIVLSTKVYRGQKTWEIFFWLGTETSQDESGAAAIYTVQLDDSKFQGKATQHREVQNEESVEFKALFNKIQYLPGGVASGLKTVEKNTEKAIYLVKGKKNARVKLIETSTASLNQGDCFIYDTGSEIYVYQGPKSTRVEQIKSVSAANYIRDTDRHGRAKVIIFDRYASQSDKDQFLKIFQLDSLEKIPSETVGVDDLEFEKNYDSFLTLHKVSDSSGSIKIEKIPNKPFTQELLDTKECYILETKDSNIYVWQGRKSSPAEKTESMKKAEELKRTNKYPGWIKIVKIPENTETSMFTQLFQGWKGYGESHSRILRDTSDFFICEPKEPKLYHLISFASKLFIKYIPDFDQANLEPNDVMLVDDECKVFVWFGKDSSDYERKQGLTPSRFLPRFMQNQKPQYLETLYFKQNSEPYEFIQMFPRWSPNFWNKNNFEDENEIPYDK